MDIDILVSVIVPVYNVEAHIRKTLSAIIAQDYRNIEILIVNDASSDSSRDIAQSLLTNSGRRFRIIDHPQNLGVSAARNTGINSARGKYIWFCDSDDIPDQNFITSLLTEAENKHADIVFCSIRNYYESENRFVDEPITFMPDSVSPADYLNAWASQKLYIASVWNFLFARKLITDNNLNFYEDCILGEDNEFVLKAIACASRVSYAAEILYTYVIYLHNGGQGYSAKMRVVMMHHLMLSRMRASKFLRKRTHSSTVRKYILSFYLPDVIVKHFTVCAAADDREQYLRLARNLKHKALRKILLSTARFIFSKPELFFKSLMLLYAPSLYYLLRRGK